MDAPATFSATPKGTRDIVIRRRFDAPRDRVYAAMTETSRLARWLTGPPGWRLSTCENDVRVGGGYRFVWTGPEDLSMRMEGEYGEVVPPERLVRTERLAFGPAATGGEQLGTLELEAEGERTHLTLTVTLPTESARDAALGSGMAEGLEGAYRSLDEVLASTEGPS